MKGREGQVILSAVPSTTLDWKTFCVTHFPGRRRHDFEALVAYGAYKRLGTLPSADPVGLDEVSAGEASSLAAWEDEGGGGSWTRDEARVA